MAEPNIARLEGGVVITTDANLYVQHITRLVILELTEACHMMQLVASEYILKEVASKIVDNIGKSQERADEIVDNIRVYAVVVELPDDIPHHLPENRKDDPVVHTVIISDSDFLVTDDKKLVNQIDAIAGIRDFRPVSLEDFLLVAAGIRLDTAGVDHFRCLGDA